MRTFQSVALLAAGKIRDSFLKTLPSLEEMLGPVRSSSLRLASRICGILGCGHPVDSFAEFDGCELILISVPEPWLPAAVDEMLESTLQWRNKTVLLCDPEIESSALSKLAFVGAMTASLTPVEGLDGKFFIAEGDRRAIRAAKRLVEHDSVRVLTIESGRKAHYRAGVAFATTLAMPLLTACVETFRAAGLEQNEATTVATRLFSRTMRSYVKAGRRSWEGPLVGKNIETIRRQVQALLQTNPALASYFYESSVMAVQLMRQDPKWLTKLAADVYSKAAGD
jgi:predicted short-subunit dehydrogenase-like oxidoreductase (DUF2520 family)